MATITLSLPVELGKYGQDRVKNGNFSSMTDYVSDLIRHEREHHAENQRRLAAKKGEILLESH